ncbi:paralemmin-1-like [Salarias fasciatus]|uniref:paralemmin-1-like n=1 Tax=Salarias fasciatus TaxID=181472 RepID=UPI001176ED1D|nr:paralemmin-1-like [Salarias fasciatus]
MSHQMFHETGQDGRSVLGMLEVQVERDPKTGATVVRSVAPVSAPAGGPNATTVFDDGRKSIHALGGSAAQPSTEELGQILSAIDGVGMKVLLEEVAVTPNKAEAKSEDERGNRALNENILPLISTHTVSKVEKTQLDDSRSDPSEAVEKSTTMVVTDVAQQVDHIEDQRLEEGPVTLMFLGYTDGTTGEDEAQEDQGGPITVERVMITEDGEEHVLGPQTSVSLQPPSDRESQDVKRKPEGLQDVPLEENVGGAKVKEGDEELQESSLPTAAEGGGKAKRKTCQCCSVM